MSPLAMLLAIPAVVALGAAGAVASALNGLTGRRLGPLRATYTFLGVGALISAALAWALGEPSRWRAIAGADPVVFLPGAVNLLFILSLVMIVNVIGVMLTTSCIFIGQLLVSTVLDHIGFMGLPVVPATPARLIALAALIGSLALLLGSRQYAPSAIARASNPPAAPPASGAANPSHATAVATGYPPARPAGAGRSAVATVAEPQSSASPVAGPRVVPAWLRAVTALLAVVLGTAIGMAMALNAVLGQVVGTLSATALFLAPGGLALALWFHLLRPRPLRAPFRPLYILPGTLNVLKVAGGILLMPLVGLQLYMAATFASSILSGMVIDRSGWFEMPVSPITRKRIAAAVLLVVGVALSVGPR